MEILKDKIEIFKSENVIIESGYVEFFVNQMHN